MFTHYHFTVHLKALPKVGFGMGKKPIPKTESEAFEDSQKKSVSSYNRSPVPYLEKNN